MAARSNQNRRFFSNPGRLVWHLMDRVRQHGERRSLSPGAALGRKGEDVAHRYLEAHGMSVLARNFRPAGAEAEVDIVAQDGPTLVFVEVKSRSTAEYGEPDRAIGDEKQRHMVRAARSYATRAGIEWSAVRFDVVGVVFQPHPVVTHQRDAFFPRR